MKKVVSCEKDVSCEEDGFVLLENVYGVESRKRV